MPSTKTLQEMFIVAHLNAPLNVTVLDMASWAEAFENDYPLPQQTPPSPPLSLNPTQLAFQFGEGLPRLILRSAHNPFVVQLQADRFGFSWTRRKDLGQEDDYVGYEKMVVLWSEHFARFSSWFKERFGAEPNAKGIEIAYLNAFPVEKADGTRARLSEVFRFVSPGSRGVNAFSAGWTELLHVGDNDAPRVHAQIGFGFAPTGQNVFFFNFTGVSLVGSTDGKEAFRQSLDSLHERIIEVHRSAISA